MFKRKEIEDISDEIIDREELRDNGFFIIRKAVDYKKIKEWRESFYNYINIKNNKFIDKIESLRKKISIDGIIYNSISEACKKLHKRHDYILWRLQSKSYLDWFYLYNHDSNKEIETGPIKKKKVSINGITYESISNAVIGSGIDRQVMRYRLKSKNYPEYFYI